MDDREKIDLILDWAAKNPEFETMFVEKMAEKLEKFGVLTERQSEALDNIIERWGIE